MSWNNIKTEADMANLMRVFGDFHDGCVREVHIWTDTYVNDDLSMTCSISPDTQLRMLIQRQWGNPSAIELQFGQVVGFRLTPAPENYDEIIFSATLEFRDGAVFWADATGAEVDGDDTTWVKAKEMSWREASEWMGSALRYGSGLNDANVGG